MSLLLKVCVHLFSIPMEFFFFSKKEACIPTAAELWINCSPERASAL